jgi:hypothetical protein
MGYRVLLIAVNGKDPATIHADLGVVPTPEYEEIAESPIVGADLSDGDYLLYINDQSLIDPDEALFARLSSGAKLLACYVNETCMESLAACWIDGHEEWRVHHDAAKSGIEHLETDGNIPREFTAIRDSLLAKRCGRDDPDYVFDIPVELAKKLGGFRYDEDIPGAGPKPFQVLKQTVLAPAPPAPERRTWWQFWR